MFISHRLEEVFASCQRVTIMRDGRFVRTAPVDQIDVDDDHPLDGRPGPGRAVPQDRDRARRLGPRRRSSWAAPGSSGTSRSPCTRARSSLWPDWSAPGAARWPGRSSASTRSPPAPSPSSAGRCCPTAPAAAMAAGMALVPEDRRQQGLVMDLGIDQNVALASMSRLQRAGLIRRASETALAATWAERLQLKYGRLRNPVATLSGGNQQKVVLGKWLARNPEAADHRRADPGHRRRHQGRGPPPARLPGGRRAGRADDLLRTARGAGHGRPRPRDLREGRITAELSRAEADEDTVMRAATGQVGPTGTTEAA